MVNAAAQSLALSIGVSALVTVACGRVRLPALLPLLLAGLALGTSGVGLIDASTLGPALRGFITVAIGLLIFEGALHLNKHELTRAPRAVWGLLTVGAIVTWIGSAAAARWLLGLSIPAAVLLGAIMIVTGPTVVQPILRLLRVSPRLHATLAAEAVLIDPLGVVATVTTMEVVRLYTLAGPQLGLASEGAWLFAKPLLGGAGVGVTMGLVGYSLLRALGRTGRPEPQVVNLIAVGVCMMCVGIGESITPEAGLAAVTICGVIMARATVLGATELRAFKELLAVILVGTLFILLSSRFDLARLSLLTWQDAAFIVILLFVIRPVAVGLSTIRSRLTRPERAFAATFAPRGIVALSVAAVASADLAQLGPQAGGAAAAFSADAQRLELVTFAVIAGTVVFASVLSPLWALLLKVKAGEGSALLLVGAHPMSLRLADLLHRHRVTVRIIDSNDARVSVAARAGIDALAGDATDARWMDDIGSPPDAGWVLAWTGNHDVDQLVARWAQERFGPGHAAAWSIKPVREPLEQADISGGEPITEWLDRFGDREVDLVESKEPGELARVLGWAQNGGFRLNTAGSKFPAPDLSTTYFGLIDRAGARGRRPASGIVGGASELGQ